MKREPGALWINWGSNSKTLNLSQVFSRGWDILLRSSPRKCSAIGFSILLFLSPCLRSLGDIQTCASVSTGIDTVPPTVEYILVVDSTASMNGKTSGGKTRWDELRAKLIASVSAIPTGSGSISRALQWKDVSQQISTLDGDRTTAISAHFCRLVAFCLPEQDSLGGGAVNFLIERQGTCGTMISVLKASLDYSEELGNKVIVEPALEVLKASAWRGPGFAGEDALAPEETAHLMEFFSGTRLRIPMRETAHER